MWRERERERFARGHYKSVVWANDAWYREAIERDPALADHYLHVSVDDPRLVAYTESAEKGEADRQTKVKPGRYLQKFFADTLTSEVIRDLVGEHKAKHDKTGVQFAHTPDEIEHVYRNGPASCMSRGVGTYDTDGIHPTRVYGAGDLAVAYTTKADGEDISARVLCWPERKRFGRVYGDSYLGLMLRDMGYVEDWNFSGARLLRIETRWGSIVAPYIDGDDCELDDSGDYLVICQNGEYTAHSTNGLINDNRSSCDRCGERMDEDEHNSVGDDTLCDSCYHAHACMCDGCEESYYVDDLTYVESMERCYCRSCLRENTRECDECEERFDPDDLTTVHDVLAARERTQERELCESCYHDVDAEECSHCGEHHVPDSLIEHMRDEHGIPDPLAVMPNPDQIPLALETAA